MEKRAVVSSEKEKRAHDKAAIAGEKARDQAKAEKKDEKQQELFPVKK